MDKNNICKIKAKKPSIHQYTAKNDAKTRENNSIINSEKRKYK
jgi:hypothetical protein